jgi:hypothetical protein
MPTEYHADCFDSKEEQEEFFADMDKADEFVNITLDNMFDEGAERDIFFEDMAYVLFCYAVHCMAESGYDTEEVVNDVRMLLNDRDCAGRA